MITYTLNNILVLKKRLYSFLESIGCIKITFGSELILITYNFLLFNLTKMSYKQPCLSNEI